IPGPDDSAVGVELDGVRVLESDPRKHRRREAGTGAERTAQIDVAGAVDRNRLSHGAGAVATEVPGPHDVAVGIELGRERVLCADPVQRHVAQYERVAV